MAIIIVPKVIEGVDVNKPLIFLAGPIRGGGDWQTEMANILVEQCADVQVACPARWTDKHPLSRYFLRSFSDAPNRQLHWERHYMDRAALDHIQLGTVLFWLGLEDVNSPHPGPEPYAMDTRREIGKFTGYKKLLRQNPDYDERITFKGGQKIRRLNRVHDCRMVVGGDENFYGLSVIKDELNDAEGKEFPFYTRKNYDADAIVFVLRS